MCLVYFDCKRREMRLVHLRRNSKDLEIHLNFISSNQVNYLKGKRFALWFSNFCDLNFASLNEEMLTYNSEPTSCIRRLHVCEGSEANWAWSWFYENWASLKIEFRIYVKSSKIHTELSVALLKLNIDSKGHTYLLSNNKRPCLCMKNQTAPKCHVLQKTSKLTLFLKSLTGNYSKFIG